MDLQLHLDSNLSPSPTWNAIRSLQAAREKPSHRVHHDIYETWIDENVYATPSWTTYELKTLIATMETCDETDTVPTFTRPPLNRVYARARRKLRCRRAVSLSPVMAQLTATSDRNVVRDPEVRRALRRIQCLYDPNYRPHVALALYAKCQSYRQVARILGVSCSLIYREVDAAIHEFLQLINLD
ncbi:MAG: helix-turn-helix domain-containing protein [Pirellulaceae bacterium]|nr:helix-turn-helix domain-containing protein [Planctomycetales bacterium]